jgi:hypothetical protein
MKKRIVIFGFLLLVGLQALDWFTMEVLYFQFPNYTEWDTSPWYNFIHHRKKIQFKENENKTLLVGSSIALYSTLPQLMNESENKNDETLIKDSEKGKSLHADLYSHVAMTPTDFYFYLDDIISHKPDIVVYVFNPADFQLEYLSLSEDNSESANFNYDQWLGYFHWRNPARTIYPFSFFADFAKDLPKNDSYKLLGKSFLRMNRFREFFWDPINSYLEVNFRSGRSYHIYSGKIPKEGIWQSGWTKKEFQLTCDIRDEKIWKENIFIPDNNTDLYVKFANGRIENFYFEKKGWQIITLDFSDQENHATELEFKVSKGFSYKEAERKPYGKDYEVGIRLSQNFCSRDRKLNQAYIRPNYLDESRFENMSLAEYKDDYFQRLYADAEDRPELLRMKTLSAQKILLKDTEFTNWLEFNRLEEIQTKLEKEKIRFILVMSPENPLEVVKYKKGRWYNGMLDHLGNQSQGHFYDFTDLLKDPRSFSDPHHLTYKGAIQFTNKLKEILLWEFEQGD